MTGLVFFIILIIAIFAMTVGFTPRTINPSCCGPRPQQRADDDQPQDAASEPMPSGSCPAPACTVAASSATAAVSSGGSCSFGGCR